MRIKESAYGIDTKEVWVNGRYAGLASLTSIPTLQRLEQSLNRSTALRQALGEVMVCRSPAIPIANTTTVAWLRKYGSFACHVWIDPIRGVLWSPVAWTMTMIVCKAKQLELSA